MNQDFPLALSYDDVLLVPQYSTLKSRQLVDLTTSISPKITLNLPFISSNMNDVTGVKMAITMGKLGALGILPRFESIEKQAEMVSQVKNTGVIAAASLGVKDGYLERAEVLVNAGASIILVDVAHGHMQSVLDVTSDLKNKFGENLTVISGAIATYEAAEDLFKAGADCVKVGVGAGSICTTRIVTGSGVPNLTAILEASRAAKKFGKTVLADAGMKNSGDVAKALAAGASVIKAGNLFAGTDEAPGELIEIDGHLYKTYNGSTSLAEKTKHLKKVSELDKNYINHVEGVESMVKYKGPVEEIIKQLEYGVKSALTYSGAKNIPEFWEKARFIRVSPNSIRENGAHDVILKDK